jgi:hypothetical protein
MQEEMRSTNKILLGNSEEKVEWEYLEVYENIMLNASYESRVGMCVCVSE